MTLPSGIRRTSNGRVKRMLHRPPRLPVLGLSRRRGVGARLDAFELGVDDILSTPFVPAELLARCRAITRRSSGANWSVIPPIVARDVGGWTSPHPT